MQYYWAELTISDGRASVSGDAARDKVRTDLGLRVEDVGGEAARKPAWILWKGKKVTSELLPIVIKQAAKDKGLTYEIVFKESRTIRRTVELYGRYNAEVDAQREGLNALARSAPPYIIIGDGAAATVNHTTLRQTTWGRDRVAPAEILHIGFQDPWAHYNKHEMGQYPQLLGLPGFSSRPVLGTGSGEESTSAPRDSTKFASDTMVERKRLSDHVMYNKEHLWGFLGQLPQTTPLVLLRLALAALLIAPRDAKAVPDHARGAILKEGIDEQALDDALAAPHPDNFPRYRILLADLEKNLYWWYADKIDICTGAGKPRAVDETMIDATTYEAVRTRIWEPVESWDEAKLKRTILSGTEALYKETDWTIGARYCVMGAGGVGVNMIERAERSSPVKWLDWLATKTQHESFPIARNDILVKHRTENRAMVAGELGETRTDQVSSLVPAHPAWRYGQGSDIDKVTVASNVVTVTFKSSANNYDKARGNESLNGTAIPAQVVDHDGVSSALASGAFPYAGVPVAATKAPTLTANQYHRLIRCSGQDIRDVGHAEKVAAMLELVPIESPSDGRMVGLQTKDGSVRVLGAAGTGNANLVDKDNAANKKMTAYHGTLPAQGQIMMVGFVFSALNVAIANHYFDPGSRKLVWDTIRSLEYIPTGKWGAFNTPWGVHFLPEFVLREMQRDVFKWVPAEPNINVNTMSEKELSTCLGDTGLASAIVRARKMTQSGYTSVAELKADLVKQATAERALVLLDPDWATMFDDGGKLPTAKLKIEGAGALATRAGDSEAATVLGEKIVAVRGRVKLPRATLKIEVKKVAEAKPIVDWETKFDSLTEDEALIQAEYEIDDKIGGPLALIVANARKPALEGAFRALLKAELTKARTDDVETKRIANIEAPKLEEGAVWDRLCDEKLAVQYRPADPFVY